MIKAISIQTKFMYTFLIILAVIAVVIFILANTAPKQMLIEKSIVITKPIQEVFSYLKYIKNQDNFSVWNMTDPTMNKSYKGEDGNIGFVYSWESNNKNVGQGEQEITAITENKIIVCEVRFTKPMQNVAEVSFELKDNSNNTTNVAWVFKSPTKFPMSIMTGVFVKMLGKDIAQGLQNLKSLLEK